MAAHDHEPEPFTTLCRRVGRLVALSVAVVLLGALVGCSSSTVSHPAAASGPSPARPTTTLSKLRGSTGCGQQPAVHGLSPKVPGDVALTFTSAGVERSYRLAVPDSYDRSKPAPLILNLHGSGSNALQESIYTDLPRRAAARTMITVTPDAVDHKWQLSPKGADDDFLVALVRKVEAGYCVDLDRVYVSGFSLGAWKAAETACAHPDMFAAAGLVAVEVHPGSCRPTPVIVFHGTADHTVPYGAGADPGVVVRGFNAGLPGTRDNIASWARSDGCSSHLQVRHIGTDVVSWTYRGCAPGVDVQLYTVLHGGHSWPGSAITIAPTTHTIDATKLILDFFRNHPMRNDQP